jgi:hypothetical protein
LYVETVCFKKLIFLFKINFFYIFKLFWFANIKNNF